MNRLKNVELWLESFLTIKMSKQDASFDANWTFLYFPFPKCSRLDLGGYLALPCIFVLVHSVFLDPCRTWMSLRGGTAQSLIRLLFRKDPRISCSVFAVSTGQLSSGRLNLAQIRESYVRDVLNLLDSVGGTKCLVWDDELTGPVSTVIEYHILRVRLSQNTLLSSDRESLCVQEENNKILARDWDSRYSVVRREST